MQFLEKILVFGSILGLLEENCAQQWTETINFGYNLFPLKLLILKDCLETSREHPPYGGLNPPPAPLISSSELKSND